MTTSLKERTDRDALVAALNEARARTDDLFSILKPEALYERPIPERHRLIFYRGHLEAFDWNLVARQGFGVEAFDPRFDKLFAFGIDPTDGGLPSEPASDWPRPEEVEAYNSRTRDVVDELLLGTERPSSGHDPATLFHMAIEHRLMHAETLAYLMHRLPHDRKHRRRDPVAPPPRGEDARTSRSIPSGAAVLGRSRAEGRFGWDNEFDSIEVEVPAFTIGTHKVTNARFLEFVEDGGYEARSLWTDRDWEWKERQKIRHPSFWVRKEGIWLHRGMFEDLLLPDAPVYVSLAEARAFARWAGGAIPTEAQFHRAAYGSPDGSEREYPWGNDAPTERHGNFGFRRWDPTPVGCYPQGRSAHGVEELVGNGWEWTSSRFEPFPGFTAHPFYAGYSADFFDGDHYVMKGGSPRTATAFLRRTFRNWFQPRYPYVYATFRLVGA